MFWLTSLQNTLFPFSLATYEEPRVKNNVISRKLFTNFYYARRNDARRTSRALAFLLYFFSRNLGTGCPRCHGFL